MTGYASSQKYLEIRAQIYEDLHTHVVHSDNPGAAYICYEDVRKVWSGAGKIQSALYPTNLSDTDVQRIQDKLLRFMSILVYIEAHAFLDDFQRRVLDDKPLQYSDVCLPYERAAVPQFEKQSLINKFLNDQYLFIPEVIIESATVSEIDERRRLPFKKISRGLFAGAYGMVDKIEISPLYLRTTKNATFQNVITVACKRFHAAPLLSPADVKREVDNLQILKESITSHNHVRQHIAILRHRGEHLILLPWADQLDLELFLAEGLNARDQKEYDFNERFPNFRSGNALKDICVQMHYVAHALRWLHQGVCTEGTQNRTICFAHRDLKPNNILIDNNDPQSTSCVGKWVLTDFGISAFKEDDDSEPSALVSVHDYYRSLTVQKPSLREPGTYQPPEVERAENRKTGGNVGRSSDIWSFGCIFSEVLVFSLGQAKAVTAFRKAREVTMEQQTTDYFYEKVPSQHLRPDSMETVYQVLPRITKSLRQLPTTYAYPGEAIKCCVETILEILMVQAQSRPMARDLYMKMKHIVRHVEPRILENSANCPLQKRPPQSRGPTLSTNDIYIDPQNGSNVPTIRLAGADSTSDEIMLEGDEFRNGSDVQSSDISFQGVIDRRPDNRSVTHISSHVHHNPELDSSDSGDFRNNLHKVTIDLYSKLEVGTLRLLDMPGLEGVKKIVSVSLCSSGHRVAYLTKLKNTPYVIRVYELNPTGWQNGKSGAWSLMPLAINLRLATKWKHVLVSGESIVAWGEADKGAHTIFMKNRAGEKVWNTSEQPGLAHRLTGLHTVAVSKYGSIVFVCTGHMFYTELAQEIIGNLGHRQMITATKDCSFKHAAFNDAGSMLYAWEFGRPNDHLYIWHIENPGANLIFSAAVDSEGSYDSKQQGETEFTLIPYNSYRGCIIQEEGGVFFPAQIRSTQRGSTDTLPKKTVTLPSPLAGCIYRDHILLTVERGFWYTRIWKHRIISGATHTIEQGENPIVEWRLPSSDKIRQMRVAALPNTRDLVLIICMVNAQIVMVPITVQLDASNIENKTI